MEIRKALIDYINNPHTHASLPDAVSGLPDKFFNEKPAGASYSFWEQLEHIRISQRDMVDFMVNANYKEMKWPEDYWPRQGEKADKKMWKEAISIFQNDEETLKKIIADPSVDLLAKIPHGSGQTILREILQIIDHNSYHTGQLILMRKMIGQWNP